MKNYNLMNKQELLDEKKEILKKYENFKKKKLKLDMSRGKPSAQQLDLSMDMLSSINSNTDCVINGTDYRNYGILEGIPELRSLFGEIMGVNAENVIVGGNSSLNMMFDTISCFMTHGVNNCEPWLKQGKIKFLCPSPGYDRHFAITEYFGMELIPIKMNHDGPDMETIEKLVSRDDKVKGIWCVPKYSNPQGITYSDEVVKRLSRLKPAAKDFKIFWDNAYCVHDLTDDEVELLNIAEECKKNNNEELPIIYCSTSKITFPGAGIAAMACFGNTKEVIKRKYSFQTISYDKLNQLRHFKFFKNLQNIKSHMKKHKEILKPKFDYVIKKLTQEFGENSIISWEEPKGGYFISVDVMQGCAKRVVELCKEAGVIITSAGATYPYGKDEKDSNIRLAPSYPPMDELIEAMDLFCLCVKYAALEKLAI
mgnify:FL=1